MDEIQKVLIKQGRKDLAQKYYKKVAGKSELKNFGREIINIHKSVQPGEAALTKFYQIEEVGEPKDLDMSEVKFTCLMNKRKKFSKI